MRLPASASSFLLLTAALVSMLLPACSAFKKDKDKVVITVHSQGNDMDSPQTIFRRQVEGKSVIFKILPEVTSKDVIAFHPFEAADGTFGVSLKLDFKGTNHLDIATRLRTGEILLSMVNGTVVDFVRIDKMVSDGIFTIWRGLPQELITAMDEQYPRIHEVKDAGAGSSSDVLDMTPSTATEKKNVRKRAENESSAKKYLEKENASRRSRGLPELDEPELKKKRRDGDAVPIE